MSTVNRRRRGKSLHLDLGGSDDRPPLSALFLVQFDVKAGYTIAWKKSVPGLELHDSVEFKSLPSGLHNVKEDLIYFMHGDEYAGISSFVNRTDEEWERNALMLAVGALVPLEQGRLGRSWKHAPELRRISKELVQDPSITQPLEDYWLANQGEDDTSADDDQGASEPPKPATEPPAGARRPSLASVGSRGKRRSFIGAPGAGLSPFHPARSISTFIDTFGPLIYPIYKAALLRKRILLLCEAPIELPCNFVYDISIISNIPSAIADLVPLEPLPSRLQPLFSVGVHDIDDLVGRGGASGSSAREGDSGYGWIACTTDDVLGMKSNLFDVTIKIPAQHSKQAQDKVWPTIKTSDGLELKATQRDSRRYNVLRQSQRRALAGSRGVSPAAPRRRQSTSEDQIADDSDDDTRPLIEDAMPGSFDDTTTTPHEKVVEPMSWTALAYNSFMWWASAGEQRTDLDEEAERDASMFRSLESYSDRPSSSQSKTTGSGNLLTPGAILGGSSFLPPEMAVIAYFHRFTTIILEKLAELVDAADAAEQAEETEHPENKDDAKGSIYVDRDNMEHMGLDVWSEADKKFVEELVDFYFGRKAEVQGGRIDCCGVRIV